jgi:hypothetical protein
MSDRLPARGSLSQDALHSLRCEQMARSGAQGGDTSRISLGSEPSGRHAEASGHGAKWQEGNMAGVHVLIVTDQKNMSVELASV